mmetsp:Transcript_41843/g.100518  ORF Transcript_41843/g.100518 Transcript_41843/m.100518 type:complete len:135 (+) Transcript_41843:91-495(+)
MPGTRRCFSLLLLFITPLAAFTVMRGEGLLFANKYPTLASGAPLVQVIIGILATVKLHNAVFGDGDYITQQAVTVVDDELNDGFRFHLQKSRSMVVPAEVLEHRSHDQLVADHVTRVLRWRSLVEPTKLEPIEE